MISHLRVQHWERIEMVDEVDLVGGYAQKVLRRYGNLWPFNVHFSAPLVERARSGTLVTGSGGDEIFGPSRFPRVARWLSARDSFPHRIRGRAAVLAPRPVKQWFIRGQLDADRPWMDRRSRTLATRKWAHWSAEVALRRDRALREWLWPSRYWQLASVSLSLVGDLFGATIVSPFMTAEFVAAAADAMGPAGFANRAQAIEGLLGADLLPPPVVQRRTKATFDGAFFAGPSRAFVNRWRGEGLDNPHVNRDLLVAEFHRTPRPDARSYALVKAAWLATSPMGP